MPDSFIKDPNSVLDYKFDFAALTNGSGDCDWLESGDTIASKVITEQTGITIDSSNLADSDTSVVVWVSGGTAGNVYTIACKITTALGRTVERTISIRVMDR